MHLHWPNKLVSNSHQRKWHKSRKRLRLKLEVHQQQLLQLLKHQLPQKLPLQLKLLPHQLLLHKH
jgi:hypothetical protein